MESLRLKATQAEYQDVQDGWPIAYRPYGLGGPKTPVIMLHGLESHSGWFVQSAEHISGLGHPVYAMDRRGSGMSKAPRGSCKNFEAWLSDIELLANEIMQVHNYRNFHLLGHCFGAIPAVAFACQKPEVLASLILATPAIYTIAEPGVGDKIKILWSAISGRDIRIPVPLEADWFTDDEAFIRFIEDDDLALKHASTGIYWQTMRARKFIHKNESKLTLPVMMSLAGKDRICDNLKNQQFFDRIPSVSKSSATFPEAVHILEFSTDKDSFFSTLETWLTDSGEQLA